jgi:hypothetical protein
MSVSLGTLSLFCKTAGKTTCGLDGMRLCMYVCMHVCMHVCVCVCVCLSVCLFGRMKYRKTRYVRQNVSIYQLLSSCRSQWLRGLRRGSTAARLLQLRVRIPPGACLSIVSVVCCQLEVLVLGWSLIQSSPVLCLNVIVKPG